MPRTWWDCGEGQEFYEALREAFLVACATVGEIEELAFAMALSRHERDCERVRAPTRSVAGDRRI